MFWAIKALLRQWLPHQQIVNAEFSLLDFDKITPASEPIIWGETTKPLPMTVIAVFSHLQGVHTECFGAIYTGSIHLLGPHYPIPYSDGARQPLVSTASQIAHQGVWRHKDSNAPPQWPLSICQWFKESVQGFLGPSQPVASASTDR